MGSLHNGLTSNPKLQEAYRRALGEQSQGFSGLERGSESLQPVIDLWSVPEWALLRGEVLYSRRGFIAAGAALFSSTEFVNPAGSGILAVVYEITNQSAISFDVAVDVGPALGVVATFRGLPNDTRWPQLGEVSQCTLVTGQLAAGVALPQDTLNASVRVQRPYIVAPGRKIFTIGTVVNTAMSMGFFWSERRLLANEQNP